MNRLALPILTAFVLSPIAIVAQAQSAQTAPVLYAEAETPAPLAYTSSSSSSSNDYDYAAPASASAAGAAAGQQQPAVNRPDNVKPFSAVGVGFKVGIGGIGFDVAVPVYKRLNVRGGAGFFSYTYNGTVNNEPVNAKLNLNNAELMLDYFPFNGGFRLSAGTTIYNKTGVSGTLSVNGGNKVTIGNASYISSPTSPIVGNLAATFGGTAVPRFTVGWGNMVPSHGHIRFEAELGLEVTGNPSTSWTFTGQGCNTSTSNCTGSSPTYGAIAASNVATQNANLQSDFNGFKVFPILNFGLSYKIGGAH